ncbi:GlxA family transcriptional regulator [Aegicerativicinus sediminis]
MKNVSIIIPRGHFSMVNLEGTHHMFSWVNGFLHGKGEKPLFKIQMVGLDNEATQQHGLYTVKPQLLIDQVEKQDIIVLPAIHGKFETVFNQNKELLPWLKEQYKKGSEIVTMCVGSFVLAESGLLDGKTCSTHWQYANEFKNRYPKVHLMDDKIITDDQGIYTSGGAYSFTNLLIYLIEKFAGREIALIASKGFMVDIDRESQSPFIMFKGQKSHEDLEILKAQNYIEAHFEDKLTVDELCEMLNISRRTFERRFKKATSNTILEYIQRVKIEAAKKDLERGQKTVNEVMFNVGYSDTKAFRETFRKITGMTPISYREKFAMA